MDKDMDMDMFILRLGRYAALSHAAMHLPGRRNINLTLGALAILRESGEVGRQTHYCNRKK
jgi:hypothetical protein